MIRKYTLEMPKRTYAGENALENLPSLIAWCRKAAVFTDRGVKAAGVLELVTEQAEKAGKPYVIFDELPPEPSYQRVQELIDAFRASGADVILAAGGGSVMDAAKLASVLATDEYTVKDLLDTPGLAKKRIPTVMIPTTAGTGAEVTYISIVAVPEKEVKIGIVSPEMIADYVILDVRMIRALPRPIAASTGIDALCHAVECYTGRKANPFSDLFALEAADLIFSHIERACDDPEALEDKRAMQLGAYLAGEAIVCSGTTAVHGLSYPLGGKYHIAHGVSNAMLLVPVMRFNEPEIRPRLAGLFERCVHDGTVCRTEEEKSAHMIERMSRLVRHLDIPTNLGAFGVPRSDLDALVASGLEQQRLLTNNMREVTAEAAAEIYLAVME